MLSVQRNFFELKFWPFVLLSSLFHSSLFILGMGRFPLISEQKEKVYHPLPIEIIKAQDMAGFKKDLARQLVNSDQDGLKKHGKKSFLGKKTQSFKKQMVARKVAPYRESGRKKKLKLEALGSTAIRGLGGQMGALEEKKKRPYARGMASNNDFIKDMPLGDFTKLNTTKHKYFGFYQRIREKLEAQWGNKLREQARSLRMKGRGIASGSHYITSLTITLDHKGRIIRVHLKNSSGVHELDQAAIHSFNQAGPFPNPPRDVLRKDGTAIVKWNFVVQS